MLRLLSEKEKNRSWVPFDNFFMDKNTYDKFLEQSKPYDAPVEIIKTDLSSIDKNNNLEQDNNKPINGSE